MSSIQIPPPFTFFFLLCFSSISGLPNPDPYPATIQPFHPTKTSSSSSSPPVTIPAFPEQSDVAGCPLNLPDQLLHGVKTACGSIKDGAGGKLRRSRCCPVLAAWLYYAYSETALGRVGKVVAPAAGGHTAAYDMPLLPDDSETCVADLDKALKEKGVELARPNETCDVVYCYCGIRLHPLSCSEAFSVNPQNGKLVGNERVERLEKNCLSSSNNVNGFPGLGGCSKCLNSLRLLNSKKALNTSKSEDRRTTKMHNKDCQLMGLTWLLAKNWTAYMHTVSSVLRALMLSTDGSTPRSCTLSSDGMPLAVDSTEISDQSSSTTPGSPISICIISILLLYMHFTLW